MILFTNRQEILYLETLNIYLRNLLTANLANLDRDRQTLDSIGMLVPPKIWQKISFDREFGYIMIWICRMGLIQFENLTEKFMYKDLQQIFIRKVATIQNSEKTSIYAWIIRNIFCRNLKWVNIFCELGSQVRKVYPPLTGWGTGCRRYSCRRKEIRLNK